MLRCGWSLAQLGALLSCCALAACSSTHGEKPSYLAPDGGTAGAGGHADVGNPDGDGGPLFVGDGGLVCPPDSEDCGKPGMDGGTLPNDPPREDGGGPHLDPDGAVPPEDASQDDPDGKVVIPEPDASEPLPTTYKIDLLFVVDNSASMTEEQAALQAHFPLLISRLLSSTALGGGGEVLAGAQDIHVGVVSTDLGAPGLLDTQGCAGLGDEALLNNLASPLATGCSASTYEPRFLSYVAGSGDPAQLATDLSCIAMLGIEGCGFEQQLESMLKAVWPGDDGRITFLTDVSGFGASGQAGPGFPNGDFVRHDDEDVSVLAVVLVTDEEDCSSNTTAHLQPNASPQGLNTRCYFEGLEPEPNGLYDVERYVDGLRTLRPGYGQRVVFGAIVGVPPELVSESAIAAVDFSDAAERDAHYEAILDDPNMQYQVDDNGTPDVYADDKMVSSCMSATGSAQAPRRIVEVARGFGERGFVQSICASDWTPAMELLATRIAQARSE